MPKAADLFGLHSSLDNPLFHALWPTLDVGKAIDLVGSGCDVNQCTEVDAVERVAPRVDLAHLTACPVEWLDTAALAHDRPFALSLL